MITNNILLGMFGLGGTEIALLLGVVVLLFGGKKIPELMKGLGKGISEFKKAKDEVTNETKDIIPKQ
jgi:sec-independent protein translocase protein TatA